MFCNTAKLSFAAVWNLYIVKQVIQYTEDTNNIKLGKMQLVVWCSKILVQVDRLCFCLHLCIKIVYVEIIYTKICFAY